MANGTARTVGSSTPALNADRLINTANLPPAEREYVVYAKNQWLQFLDSIRNATTWDSVFNSFQAWLTSHLRGTVIFKNDPEYVGTINSLRYEQSALRTTSKRTVPITQAEKDQLIGDLAARKNGYWGCMAGTISDNWDWTATLASGGSYALAITIGASALCTTTLLRQTATVVKNRYILSQGNAVAQEMENQERVAFDTFSQEIGRATTLSQIDAAALKLFTPYVAAGVFDAMEQRGIRTQFSNTTNARQYGTAIPVDIQQPFAIKFKDAWNYFKACREAGGTIRECLKSLGEKINNERKASLIEAPLPASVQPGASTANRTVDSSMSPMTRNILIGVGVVVILGIIGYFAGWFKGAKVSTN